MIRCMLFLDPGGVTDPRDWELLGKIDIQNLVEESLNTGGRLGTYEAEIYKKRKLRYWKRVKVKNYPRRSYHPWELIFRILEEAKRKNGGTI